ncbi:MAG: MMPL family transporter [Pseudomonadaceae bacterium]|nr:MMPL family transporter [Pseudomonadaceae bacterium]
MTRNSKLPLLAAIFLCVISICGLPGLSVTADNRILISDDNEKARQLSEFEDRFEHQNIIGFVATCEQEDKACIHALPELVTETTARAKSLPYAVSTKSLSNLPYLLDVDDEIVQSNYLDFYCDPTCPSKGRSAMKHSDTLVPFISDDGSTMAIYANLSFEVDQVEAVQEIFSATQTLISDINQKYRADIRFVGRLPMMHAFIETTNKEITTYMGAAIILIFFLVWLCFSSIRLTIIAIGLGITSILSTLGLAGWAGVTLSTASATLPTIIFTLTTATSMHYFMHVLRTMTEDSNRDLKKVAFGAVSFQLVPTLITAGSTAAAMLSMILVESPPFQTIGIWTAVSLFYCCTILFLVVPHLVARLPKLSGSNWQKLIQPALNQHARYIGSMRQIALIGAFACVLSMVAITQLNIDDDFVRFFGEETTFRKDTEFVSANLIGPTNIEIVINSGNQGGVNKPDFLKSLSTLTTFTRKHSQIDSTTSIIDVYEKIVPLLSESGRWQDLEEYALAQSYLIYELSLTSAQARTDYVDSDKQFARISLIAKDLSSKEIVELEKELFKKSSTLFPSKKITITGEAIPLAHLSRDNIPGVATSLIATCAILSILLAMYFRSIRTGVALFCTTIVPIVCGFGIWSLFANEIGIAAVVTLAVCMGVVIDDSVHLIYRFHDATKRLGLGSLEAASYAVHRVGGAVITTTVILALGFGVLTFSDFQINSTFGLCTVLILVSALLIDLLILPSLLPSNTDASAAIANEQRSGNHSS